MWARGGVICLVAAIGLSVPAISASGVFSTSLIPDELIEYFHPWSREESRVLPGVVLRQRRETVEMEMTGTGQELIEDDTEVFRISKKYTDINDGTIMEEMCMFIRTQATFQINFETRPGAPKKVDSKTYRMPRNPDMVNGTCALETETSRIFIFWSGFNFSIEFVKNPEGNSYYMNRAILVYYTEHPDLKQDFLMAQTHGKVHLETRPGKNFFFTPLGQSYFCISPLDQGPMKLWNINKNQIEGKMDLADTKFQPFVVRAHGEWGPSHRCLPHEIREMREEFWPFVSAAAVLVISGLLVGGYGVKRTWFTDQKVDYGTYEPAANQDMEMVRQPSESGRVREEAKIQEAQKVPVMTSGPSANPFQAKSANPFQKDQSNPFH